MGARFGGEYINNRSMYLFWSILNSAVIVAWLFISYLSIKLVKKEYGILPAVIMALGIISIFTTSYSSGNNTILLLRDRQAGDVIQNADLRKRTEKNTILEDSPLFNIRMISSFEDVEGKPVPVFVNISMNGFVSGFSWQTQRANIEVSGSNSFAYVIVGNLKWKLFGLTVYTEQKVFRGII